MKANPLDSPSLVVLSMSGTPEALAALVTAELSKWAALIKAAQIPLQ